MVFSTRAGLLFITAVVIIFSLITSLLALPRISKEKKAPPSNAAKIAVLQDVVDELKNEENECVNAVILGYTGRIRALEKTELGRTQQKEYRELRELVRRTERDILSPKQYGQEISTEDYDAYRNILTMMHENEDRGISDKISRSFRKTRLFWKAFSSRKQMRRKMHEAQSHSRMSMVSTEDRSNLNHQQEFMKHMEEMFWHDTNCVIEVLEKNRGKYSDEAIDFIIKERIDRAGQVMERLYGGALHARLHDEYESVLLQGFAIEREKITEHLADGRLIPEEADTMRVSVNTLETFALTDHATSVLPKIIMNRLQSHQDRHGGPGKRPYR
jgi:hypothetical protein